MKVEIDLDDDDFITGAKDTSVYDKLMILYKQTKEKKRREEENKIKVDDWVFDNSTNTIFRSNIVFEPKHSSWIKLPKQLQKSLTEWIEE